MTTTQLRNEIGQWADHCFTHKTSSQLGVLEEIGEIAHVVLKERQGIRGYDDPAKVSKELNDGIADCCIYLLHWCKMNDVQPPEWPTLYAERTVETSLSRLAVNAGMLLNTPPLLDNSLKKDIVTRILEELTNLAALFNWNLYRDCVAPTWEKVSQRDWKKNKLDGSQSTTVTA